MRRFLNSLWAGGSYSSEKQKLSVDPTAAEQPIASKVDPTQAEEAIALEREDLELPDVDLKEDSETTGRVSIDCTQAPELVELEREDLELLGVDCEENSYLGLPDVSLEESSEPMGIEMPEKSEIREVKMERRDGGGDGELNDIPVVVDKVARKAAKKKRRKEARLDRERQASERKRMEGYNFNAAPPGKRSRLQGSKDAVPVWMQYKRRKEETRRLKAEAAEKETKQPIYAVPWHLWGPACDKDRCADPNWRPCPLDHRCPERYNKRHQLTERYHWCAHKDRVEVAPHQHIYLKDFVDPTFNELSVHFSLQAWSTDELYQTFLNFDVGPKHTQFRVHEDFLDINNTSSAVFSRMVRYSELMPISAESDKTAYRIPESVETFKSWLEWLAMEKPQPAGGPELWVLDQEKASELEKFAQKWDMEDLVLEMREFLKGVEFLK